MFLLKKIFQLREHTNPDAEKPFLDHLEDLRVMMTRVIITLLITTAASFIFRNELMSIIRKPIEEVWVTSQSETLKDLPVTISLDSWEKAKKAMNSTLGHTEEQRKSFYTYAGEGDEKFPFHAEAAYWYRSALAIEDESQRKIYLQTLPGITEEMQTQTLALLEKEPNADLDAHGKLVLMQSLKPTEGFVLSLKLALYAGVVLAFPFLLYFIMQFVLPGLHGNERKALWPALAVGFFLFLSGVCFAYFGVLPRVLLFFYEYSQDMTIKNEWRIGYYISFATQFTLIFGLAFELPVVVMTLVKLGILEFEMMKRTRSYAILAITVIAAVITPTPDALTLSLLAVPMILLYEICIWLAYFVGKKDRLREEEEEKERMESLLARESERATYQPEDDGPAYENEDEHKDYEDHVDHDHEIDDEHHETGAETEGDEQMDISDHLDDDEVEDR